MAHLRVALVAESFHPAVDATTTTVRAVADRLVETGHHVEVVAPGPGVESWRGARVHRISPVAGPGAQVREALAAAEADVVVVTGGGGPGTLARKALKHAGRAGTRTVAVQTTPVGERQWDGWRAKVVDRAGRLLVTSPWLAERLGARGVTADLWTPGVDTDAFSPALRDVHLHDSWARARSSGGPLVTVGYVGGLHKRHGVRRLAALAEVPGIRPVVIGAGPQRDWLADHLPQAKLVGALGTGPLAVALASLDVLVHPGEEETCCHALREAGASGVPVVAPRAGGARHVVRHLETGLLHDPGDPRLLAEAVHAVARDRHRGLMGAHAREVARQRTWRDAVDELVLEHLRHLPSEAPLLASG
jgi:phosphatidylinositol alpha 1,6-mannosyltransferase